MDFKIPLDSQVVTEFETSIYILTAFHSIGNIPGMVTLNGGLLLYSITQFENSWNEEVGGVPTTTSKDRARLSELACEQSDSSPSESS